MRELGLIKIAPAILLLTAGVGPAVAQQASGIAVLDQIKHCRTIADTAQRLTCFDLAADNLQAARANDGLVVLNKTEIKAKRRALFGFQLPRINLFGSKDEEREPEITQIDTTIQSFARSGRENWMLRLADGSLWRTLTPPKLDPASGDKISIRRAALGSYFGNIAGRIAVRMERAE